MNNTADASLLNLIFGIVADLYDVPVFIVPSNV